MPMGRLNIIALGLIFPIAIVLGFPFVFLFGFDSVSFKIGGGGILGSGLTLLILFLFGALIHELLHGITWSFFASKGWKSISFGIKWEYLTPYCHCSEPLKKSYFVLGALMPCLILGVIPTVISFFTGNFKVWFFGFFFTIAASGDLIAIWMLRKVPKRKMIQDHPSEMGFIVEE